MIFFDTDTRIWSPDKLQHLVGGAGVMIAVGLFKPPVESLIWTVVIAAVFEAGQWDTARGTGLLGKPGYGFGLLDLAAGTLGALIVLGARLVLHI